MLVALFEKKDKIKYLMDIRDEDKEAFYDELHDKLGFSTKYDKEYMLNTKEMWSVNEEERTLSLYDPD